MTDNFKEIGSLFGREGAGAGFVKQTDKESFTYAFAWPEGDTWATLTGYLNLDEQPEEYVRRVLQDGGFRSDWGNPDYDPIGDFKETAGDEYRIPLLKVLLREQLASAGGWKYRDFRYRFRRGGFPLCERGGSVHLPAKSCHFRHRGDGKSRVSLPARLLEGRGDGGFLHRPERRYRSRGLRPGDGGEPVAHEWGDCPCGRVLHRYQ